MRRVARGYAEVEHTDPLNGRRWTEKGNDLFLDADFLAPSFVTHGLPQGTVAKDYRFLWKLEQTQQFQIAYEGAAQTKPFRVYVTPDAAREPVSFDKIPGTSVSSP